MEGGLKAKALERNIPNLRTQTSYIRSPQPVLNNVHVLNRHATCQELTGGLKGLG